MRARARPGSAPCLAVAPGTCSSSVVVTRPGRRRAAAPPAARGARRRARTSRRRAASAAGGRALGEQLALGEEQRQQRRPLLALRAVGAQRRAVVQQRSSSRCGPWAVKPRSRSALRRSASSAASPSASPAARARPVAQLGRARAGRAARRSSAKGCAQARRPPRAGPPSARCPCRASSASQVSSAAGPARARADAGEQRVALRERARVGRARLGARRPERGHELVEVGAARRRRALHELEPLGQEDADERPRVDRRAGCRQGAVDPQALRPRPARSPTSMRWLAVLVLACRATTRATAAPRRTSSRSFEVRGERPVQPK